jgi:hypothetical protein
MQKGHEPLRQESTHAQESTPQNYEESVHMVTNFSLNGTATAHSTENIARKVFREAISEVAEQAKQSLPNSHGRIDKAIRIVLQGDVIPFEEDSQKFAVGAESDADLYYVVDSECTCPDSDRAPDNACKHVISTWLHRRGAALAKERLAQLDVQAITKQQEIKSLPEAPASANVYLSIQGRKVQLTLRDHDENSLLTRMESLLSRFPEDSPEQTTTPPQEGWCSIHDCQMKRSKDGKGYYHKAGEKPDGKAIWCRGR